MWLDDLRPAFGQDKFFFEDEFARLERESATSRVSSGQVHPLRGPAKHGGEGRGRCAEGGTGDLRYRNTVIAPRPVAGSSALAQRRQ